ncbi:MAG: exodeoxyribonuclease VII large subunit [Verrucomicrobiota bacterium]|nr:exodeoxyribonuclease VII large subunit [Verrucomicrobiota bacterium]
MKALSVTELTFAIKSLLEPNFRAVAVRGEISNFKLQSSGHLYFSLKDAGAQISVALFKGNASQLARMPKDGDQVIALGELSIYAPRGNYQLIVRELQFLGVGELLLKFHQLKEALQARGWFDPARKKPLPKLPKRIGVVTSPTGAVIQDILNVLTRRFRGFHVILNPVKVQGDGAAQEIAQAINDFNQYNLADVLIVGRGGGSIEDLWAFNEEIVAKAIFESRIPIISAVGHETDYTIADWVADVRAPTPSAAAEIAIAEKANLLKFLASAEAHCFHRLRQQLLAIRQKLQSLQKHPLFSSPYSLLAQPTQQLDDLQADLLAATTHLLQQKKAQLQSYSKQLALLEPTQKIAQWKSHLTTYRERLTHVMHHLLAQKKERCQRLVEHLRSIHPQHLLKQGYAILFSNQSHSILRSVDEIAPEQTLRALLSDGELSAIVTKVNHDTRNSLL